MLKTILKTVALSATALTLLSACSTTTSFNSAIRAYEAKQQAASKKSKSSGFLSAGSDTESDTDSTKEGFDEVFTRLIGEGESVSTYVYQPVEPNYIERSDPVTPIGCIVGCPALSPNLEKEVTELDPLAELARIAEEQRIQAEYHAPGSTLTQVASIRKAGQYSDNGTVGYHDDDIHDITRSQTQDTFSITKDADRDNVLIMTVNGVEYPLIPKKVESGLDDYEHDSTHVYVSEKTIGTYFSVSNRFSGSGNVKEIISGTHATIQGDYVQYATDTNDHSKYQGNYNLDYAVGFATIGIQTPASVVAAQTAKATYFGKGLLNTHASEGLNNIWTWMDVAITMSVDFDANTIAGTGRDTYTDDKVVFDSAPIVGNAFAGTFRMSKHLHNKLHLIDNTIGQYGGNFFGPNADGLAGTMRFDGAGREYNSSETINIIGIGGFRAIRLPGFEE